jgi:ABC-type multidrug transport system permease subunit
MMCSIVRMSSLTNLTSLQMTWSTRYHVFFYYIIYLISDDVDATCVVLFNLLVLCVIFLDCPLC